jgi:hypothetical protein
MTELDAQGVDPDVIARMTEGYEGITDGCRAKRPAFFIHAMRVMDETLDFRTRCEIRGACTCSTGGWREKEMRRIAREYKGRSIEERIEAVGQVKYLGYPALHEDGTISGGVGTEGGFDCPCSVFRGWKYEEPVPPTYCLCCAGHFRHHYQIAFGLKLRVKAVLSTTLESRREKPCRFLFEVE